MTRRYALGTVLGAALLALAASAGARPGGGHSYHGSSHHSSSHSSSHTSHSSSSSHHSSSHSSSHTSHGSSGGSGTGSSGEPFVGGALSAVESGTRVAAWFAFAGIFLILLIVAIAIVAIVGLRHAHWDSAAALASPPATAKLEALRERDPEFSAVLFQDFAYALYARSHEARASAKRLRGLAPYLSEAARGELAAREPVGAPVRAVVIGAMRVDDVTRDETQAAVALGFEANLVVAAPGGDQTQYVRERWWLVRPASAQTRAWKGVRTFGCPACGHPLSEDASGACAHCGQRVDDGRFDWTVERLELDEIETRPPTLTGTVEEEGTDDPTVYQDGCGERLEALLRDDPALTLPALSARLGLIFGELQKGWAGQDLRGVRPFVSASLYNYLDYWVGAYRQQGLVNRVDGARIERSEVVRVLRDAHYDALTLRVWGIGFDYTTRRGTDEVVGGSRTQERRYSEYWTLVRGASVRGAPRADDRCPSCGAGLRVSMEGNCDYCGALVASGDFDWVLGQIEQDDSYSG